MKYLIAIFGVYGLYVYNEIEKLKKSSFKFKKVIIKNLFYANINADLYFVIYNNSNLTINITEQQYLIYFDKYKIATIKKDQKVKLLPKKENEIFFNLDFSPKELINKFGNITDEITVKCKIKLNFLFFDYTFNFDYKTTLKELIK